ncbi:hypothetical protein SALBM311S_09550 [Streptomyces alboniger]
MSDHGFVQGRPGEELSGDPGAPALGLRAQDCRDTRAPYRLRRERLAYEAPAETGVVGEFRAQHLHRSNGPRTVLADVHLAHTAFAQHSQ